MIKIPEGTSHVLPDGRFAKNQNGLCMAYLSNKAWGIAWNGQVEDLEGVEPLNSTELSQMTLDYYAAS